MYNMTASSKPGHKKGEKMLTGSRITNNLKVQRLFLMHVNTAAKSAIMAKMTVTGLFTLLRNNTLCDRCKYPIYGEGRSIHLEAKHHYYSFETLHTVLV